MDILGLNFKDSKEISNFIKENNNKNTIKTNGFILDVKKEKMTLRIIDGREYKFDKYGTPIRQDVFVFAGFKNKKTYELSDEMSRKNIYLMNNKELVSLVSEFKRTSNSLGLNSKKKYAIQRKSYKATELATESSYIKIEELGNDEFRIETIGEEFKDLEKAKEMNVLNLKQFKDLLKGHSNDTFLLKVKIYQNNLEVLV